MTTTDATPIRREDLLDRRLPLAGTFNVREVRDYPTADGRRVRAGLLYRGDALHRLDEEGRTALRERGLKTVLDLRERGERAAEPDALEGVGATILERPIFEREDDVAGAPEAIAAQIPDLTALYRTVVEHKGAQFAGVVVELARPDALPALVHCTAGKDRTGIVTALVLSALGVADDVVAADFSVTELCLGDEFRRGFLERGEGSGVDPAVLASLLGSEPALAYQVLAQVRARDGSAAAYLVRNGVPEEDLRALRETLLTHVHLNPEGVPA